MRGDRHGLITLGLYGVFRNSPCVDRARDTFSGEPQRLRQMALAATMNVSLARL
jgi:hypothetical protein